MTRPCFCGPCVLDQIESGTLTQLNTGADTLPKAVDAGFLFASADSLAGQAEGPVSDGAAEEFNQDHGASLVSGGERDHA